MLALLHIYSYNVDMFSRRTGLPQYKKFLTKAQTQSARKGLDTHVMVDKIFTASRLHGFTASRLPGFTATALLR